MKEAQIRAAETAHALLDEVMTEKRPTVLIKGKPRVCLDKESAQKIRDAKSQIEWLLYTEKDDDGTVPEFGELDSQVTL